MSVRVLNTKEEITEARRDARKDFIHHCMRTYGYVPFNNEYLDKCWPEA